MQNDANLTNPAKNPLAMALQHLFNPPLPDLDPPPAHIDH
jgi:hypothetical protein